MKSTCTTNNACDEPARAGDEPRIRRDKIQAICILEEKDVVKYERWDGFSGVGEKYRPASEAHAEVSPQRGYRQSLGYVFEESSQ
jgi:hypothetical protein